VWAVRVISRDINNYRSINNQQLKVLTVRDTFRQTSMLEHLRRSLFLHPNKSPYSSWEPAWNT
jgi:hypothetical protein